MEHLKQFWTVYAGAASIGGFLIAVAAIGYLWVAIALAFLVLAAALRKPTLALFRAVRSYPALLAQLAALESTVEAHNQERLGLLADAVIARRQGIQEGRQDERGVILSLVAREPPSLVSVEVFDDDVVLLGEYEPDSRLIVGARFALVAGTSRSFKGLVEVGLIDTANRLVHMTCVDSVDPVFWAKLKERSIVDTSPPDRLELLRHPTVQNVQGASGEEDGRQLKGESE